MKQVERQLASEQNSSWHIFRASLAALAVWEWWKELTLSTRGLENAASSEFRVFSSSVHSPPSSDVALNHLRITEYEFMFDHSVVVVDFDSNCFP
jgi:hypothetical protein